MNSWNEIAVYCAITVVIIIVACAAMILMASAKRRGRETLRYIGILAADTGLFISMLFFLTGHPDSYRFDNRYVYSHNISSVIERYGEYDLGSYNEGSAGRIAYYIYTDNGPIMPDHLKHYYYIVFDEKGEVTDIYDAAQPGG